MFNSITAIAAFWNRCGARPVWAIVGRDGSIRSWSACQFKIKDAARQYKPGEVYAVCFEPESDR